MKIYQKHEVTVKGSAIAVTAEFVLDTFKAFQRCDIALANMLAVGTANVTFTDDKKVEKITLRNGFRDPDTEVVVASWTYLYNVLKTTDKDFESDTIATLLNTMEDEFRPEAVSQESHTKHGPAI